MAMGTLADLEDQEPIPGKESPMQIHLKVHTSLSWQWVLEFSALRSLYCLPLCVEALLEMLGPLNKL